MIAGAGTDGIVTHAYVMTLPKWVAAIQLPISQSVNYGSNATLSLKTKGHGFLSFPWYKNGSALSGATEHLAELQQRELRRGTGGELPGRGQQHDHVAGGDRRRT